MKKKTQLIVSITGITIIILALIGLTYGYYITKIEGNESSKSVQVETGIPGVLYTDLSDDAPDNPIEPGVTITKKFKVTNTGNTSATYSIFLVDVVNNFVRTEDVTYNLYRIGNTETFPENYTGCIENPTDEMACKLVISGREFPTDVSVVEANEVITTPETYYTYAMVITYINHTTINQDVDQGHTFGGKINLRALDSETNPFGEGTLAYNIINNIKSMITVEYNKTKYIEPSQQDGTSYTIPAEQENAENERILTYTMDDYGKSYYFRGNVEDNYVNFASMCWRIVRIAGDGSIKLILEDQDQTCSTSIDGNWAIPTTTGGTTYTGNFGYTQHSSNTLTASDGTKNSSTRYLMDYLHGQTDSTSSMATAFKNFQSTFTETELSKLKSGNWCLGDNAYDSSNNLLNSTQIMDNIIKGTSFRYSYQRLGGINGYQPTLKCNGTIMNDWDDAETTSMYVGAITADEAAYAGGKFDTNNPNYYLINEEFKKSSSGANKAYYFWSLSPYNFSGSYDRLFSVSYNGNLRCDYVGSEDYLAFRPSVSLAPSVVISEGEGTLKKPYKIG